MSRITVKSLQAHCVALLFPTTVLRSMTTIDLRNATVIAWLGRAPHEASAAPL
eukprot:COSAG06_NODE_6308_length_2990_cov_3.482878_2_plen_53_part_00